MAGAKRKSLLCDDEDGELDTIKVNEAYAKRFEHNKRREDLHRLQELQKKGIAGEHDSQESTDEEEDEDGLLPDEVDAQIFDTLTKIKKKDPTIYSQEAKFYNDDLGGKESEDEKAAKTEKKKKPLYLKDVIARQLLEDGADAEEKQAPPKRLPLTYAQEQEELRRSFLQSVEETEPVDADDRDLLHLKKRTLEEIERDRKDTEEAVEEAERRAKDLDISRKLDEYFGRETDLNENEKFLKSYLLNKGWIDQESRNFPSFGGAELSEDEEELDKQDKFEADYNFRFQEEAGSQIQGHSRMVEGSVRRKSDTRKRQRENKLERQTEEERARQEELKRLKNVKKNELMERLEKIRTIAGADEKALGALAEDDLEEDFDPEEYDKKMAEAFGDGYYGAKDVDEMFNDEDAEDFEDLQKPDFEAEDELLGLPRGWEDDGKVGFAAVRAKQRGTDVNGDSGQVSEVVENGPRSESRKQGKISLEDKIAFEKKLEEYYKLDYEDMVGDLPTRFKYRKVARNTYGMRGKDILTMDDKELNQLVSLKKLAPYRTEEWQVPEHIRRHISKKERKKTSLDVVPRYRTSTKKQKQNSSTDGKDATNHNDRTDSLEEHRDSGLDTETPDGKKKQKRKRKQKGLSLPLSRLVAYGKVQPPARKKQKV